MKKAFCVLLIVTLAAICLAGCSLSSREDNTLTLYLSNREMDDFLDALGEQFPDIDFQIYQYYGTNASAFLREGYVHGQTSDLAFYTQQLADDLAEESLLDLSGYPFVSHIDPGMLQQYDIDGHIYQLPGPVVVRCMAYNQTIFDQYGWCVPGNFEELIALVKQIRVEAPDLIPIAMSLGGVGYPFTCVTTLSQAGFLSTPSGVEWEKRYLSGEASVKEGWAQGLEATARLIDAGAFYQIERFLGVWDAALIQDSFVQGEAAMMFVWAGQSKLVAEMERSSYEFGLLPFYGIENGQSVLGVNVTTNWGISKRLGEKGSEKKLANALRVLEWIVSPAGQEHQVTSAAEIPSLKNAEISTISEKYRALWEFSGNVHKALMVYAGYEDVIIDAGTLLQDYFLSGSSDGMAQALVTLTDKVHSSALNSPEEAVNYGVIAEDFSREQSVQLMADVLNSAGVADFSMITRGGRQGQSINYYGVNGWLYAGKVDNTNFNILFSGKGTRRLDVLTLTGAEIKALLEQGKPDVPGTEDADESIHWDYYWSGLDVTEKDGHLVSVRLNGTELDDLSQYRVAFLNGDYTDATAQAGKPEDTGIALSDLYAAYLSQNSPLYAPQVLRK